MERVFKWFTLPEDITLVYITWFTGLFTPEDFNGIDRLIFTFLQYCSFLGVTAQRKYLESYLVTDGKSDIKGYNIKLDTMGAFDYKEPTALEEAYRTIGKTVLEIYDKWCTEDLSERNFKVDMHEYLMKQKHDKIQDTMIKYFPKLQDGTDIDNISNEMQLDLARIDTAYDKSKLDEIDFMSGSQRTDKSKKKTSHKLFDTGFHCIDGDCGGVYTQMIYSFNGQPGHGKTRFAAKHFIYPALIAGIDVIYDSVEMKQFQIEHMLIAIHIINLYGGTIKIPDSIMNKDELTSEQRQYVESARIDLFESGKYGKLFFHWSRPVETMKKDTLNLLKRNRGIGLWVLDYMGRLKSQPQSKFDPHKQQFEIITAGYEVVRDVVDMCDISALCLNQYNEKGIQAAYAGKRILSGFVEGGHIVQRHTDYDISMTATEEQEKAGLRQFSNTKKRGNAGFENVLCYTDLSISNFLQENISVK